MEHTYEDEVIKSAMMYDPLTVYYLLKPENCKTKDYNVAIETKGVLTRGMTVADKNFKFKTNVKIVETINENAFKKDFTKTLI